MKTTHNFPVFVYVTNDKDFHIVHEEEEVEKDNAIYCISFGDIGAVMGWVYGRGYGEEDIRRTIQNLLIGYLRLEL